MGHFYLSKSDQCLITTKYLPFFVFVSDVHVIWQYHSRFTESEEQLSLSYRQATRMRIESCYATEKPDIHSEETGGGMRMEEGGHTMPWWRSVTRKRSFFA